MSHHRVIVRITHQQAHVTQPRLIMLLALLVLDPTKAPLFAQSFEAGGSLAVSCVGSDGSFCSEGSLFTAGPYGSIWLWDRMEVGARMVWFRLNDLSRSLIGPTIVDLATTERRRRVAQGEFTWHFRPGKRVRPLLGLGLGRYWIKQVANCEPQGCQGTLGPGYAFGRTTDAHHDASMTVGVSVLVNPRLRVRGGWRYHNPFHDEFALSELFVGLGYRLGGS